MDTSLRDTAIVGILLSVIAIGAFTLIDGLAQLSPILLIMVAIVASFSVSWVAGRPRTPRGQWVEPTSYHLANDQL